MTIDDVTRDALTAYVLGDLEGSERQRLEARLDRDPSLVAALAEISAGVDLLVDAEAPASSPPDEVARLQRRLQDPLGRRIGFLEPLQRIFELDGASAREILAQLDDGPTWPLARMPGLRALHFDCPLRSDSVDTGLLWVPRGGGVELHRHRGREVTLVLAGRLAISTGELLLPGDELHVDASGPPHAIRAEADADVVFALIHEGIDLVNA